MLDQIRSLWEARPALILGAIASLVFGVTLLILFLAVGGSDSANPPQEQSVATQAQEQAAQPRHETVVKVDTQSSQPQAQPTQSSEQSTAEQQTTDSEEQQAQPSDSAETAAEQSQAEEPSTPRVVAGFEVQRLSEVLTDELDEASLRHGTDGSEGGILPIDNGVVPSSGPEYETSWELIVPSAGIKSAVVRVGRTPGGAMGSPDNPHVVGWLDSSAMPGERGNTLLAGHRDFEDLSGNVGTGVCWALLDTQVGHQMILRDNERDIYYVYSVTEAETVDPYDPAAARFLENTDQQVVTLITCDGSFNGETHQYSHRRVVVGVLAAVATPDA